MLEGEGGGESSMWDVALNRISWSRCGTGCVWRRMSTFLPGRGVLYRAFSGHPRTDPLRQDGPLEIGARCGERSPAGEGGSGSLLCATRVRGRLSGLPGPVPLGRRFHQVPVRRGGRVRHVVLAYEAAVVQRKDRNEGALLCGPHAGRPGLPQSSGPCLHVHRFRRIFQCLPERHPPGGCL